MKKTDAISFIARFRRGMMTTLLLLAHWMLSNPGSIEAGTHTWTGAGLTGNWSLPANWQGNVPPAAGEAAPVVLVFPKGAARQHNTNNLAGLTIHGLTVSGPSYVIEGSGPGVDITFSAALFTSYLFNAANFTLGATLNISLQGVPQFSVSGGASIASKLIGAGGFTKSGAGELAITGPSDNQFSGKVTVSDGALSLSKGSLILGTWYPAIAVSGPLVVGGTNVAVAGSVNLIHADQIADSSSVAVQPSGMIYMGGNNETIGPLTMTGGQILGDSLETTNLGTLTLTSDVSVPDTSLVPSATITAHLALGGGAQRNFDVQLGHFNLYGRVSDGGNAAGLVKSGPGQLFLANAANTYRGLTTIQEGSIYIYSDGALGSTNNGTILHGGALLAVQGVNIPGESLTIVPGAGNAKIHCVTTSSLGGAVRLNASLDIDVDSSAQLTFSGAISGGGGVNKLGEGALVYTGLDANTYAGPTTVLGALSLNKGLGVFPAQAIAGPLIIGIQGTMVDGAHVVRLYRSNQINPDSPVTVLDGGDLSLNNHNQAIGPLTLFAAIHTGAGVLTLNGDVTADTGTSLAYIYGSVSMGAKTRTFTVESGGTLRIAAHLADAPAAVGWVKDGPGQLDLLSSSSFDGPFTIHRGDVWVKANGALGGVNEPTIVNSGARLTFDDSSVPIVSGEPIQLNGVGAGQVPKYFGALWSYGSNTLTGPITVASDAHVFVTDSQAAPGSLTLSGILSGPGKLTKNGPAPLILAGSEDNSHAGGTCVTDGILFLRKSQGAVAIPSALVANNATVRWLADNQVANNVAMTVINTNGLLDLFGYNDRVGGLNMNGGVATTGKGVLTLGGDVKVSADPLPLYSSEIWGNLSLGGADRVFECASNAALYMTASIGDGGATAGFKATGGGGVHLGLSNSFSGLVIVDDADLWLHDNFALGRVGAGLIVTNHATLNLPNVDIVGEDLTLASDGDGYVGTIYAIETNSWTGAVRLNQDAYLDLNGADSRLTLSGPITGSGGLHTESAGTLRLAGAQPNTFTGPLVCEGGMIELAKPAALAVYGDVEIPYGVVRLLASHQILDTSSVKLGFSSRFELNGFSEVIGDLSGSGQILLGNGVLTVGGGSALNVFSGDISGAGGELDKAGSNTLELRGNNTYTAGTLVKGGKLLVNGHQPASDVYVYPGATLGGTGAVGGIYGIGGTVSPGNSPGRLSVAKASSLDAATSLIIELNGTAPGKDCDQLDVAGNLAVNNAALQVAMGFAGAVSNRYVIVNHSLGATTSHFKGLPEGSILTANNGATLLITYVGGDGNDTELVQLSLPAAPQLGDIARLSDGSIQLKGKGAPGVSYTVEANDDLRTSNWLNLGSISANGLGALIFTDSKATNHVQRFYRFVAP
ncbi:MAG: autotransporter-associated beta strand repeat-containing protein [Verrucomicrobia bacterium]|nr:autotransporter-associated beta strand repeat-containing protein [Verrucomicrobiota bacterium]MBI3867222.1 autotransporter-associated beta strand repeat-containing protein [Verrucomicrobiota bacterium]